MSMDFEVTMNEYLPLRDVVFNTLRRAILRGELKPGERLMEIQLANKLGVSRTPIREAIRKLELEGLVLMVPRKGAEVAEITEKNLRDVLEVRCALEELAVQLACDRIDPERMKESVEKMSDGFIMPGWEPERLDRLKELFDQYRDVDAGRLFQNLIYFLEAIGPVCEKNEIRMGIHPDDPAWPIFGLPRIVTGKESILRILKAVDKPYNGITFCTGSLGSNPENDLLEIIRACRGRIPFAHIRNLKYNSPRDFEEAAHLSSDGSLDLYQIIKTLYETGFDGVIRPDHGRMIWGEKAMPGYGLYDRALGAVYLEGLWEAVHKERAEKERTEKEKTGMA